LLYNRLHTLLETQRNKGKQDFEGKVLFW